VLYRSDLESNLNVCPKCGHHQRIRARQRIDLLLDPRAASRSVPRWCRSTRSSSRTPSVPDRLAAANEDTGEADALVVMQGAIKTVPVVVACFEFEFMAARWARWWASACGREGRAGAAAAFHLRHRHGRRAHAGRPVLADADGQDHRRIQLAERKLPFITVLTDPTMGGVSASFAFMGDMVIAEPGA
jgi:acetyl-CoA carboxylase carboxyl transferase subunit beta